MAWPPICDTSWATAMLDTVARPMWLSGMRNDDATLLIAAAIFSVGLYGAISQQVVVMVMMGLELMINAVILAAAGVWWFLAPDPTGQVLLMVIIAAMTVEMAMGFAVATLLHRERGADMTDMATDLSG